MLDITCESSAGHITCELSGGLFHPYILEESICYLKGIRWNSLGLFSSRLPMYPF